MSNKINYSDNPYDLALLKIYGRTEMKTVEDSIKKVIFIGDRTIILWTNGTKTIVKCSDGDEFDYYSGFCVALAKKIFGSTAKARRFMESKMVDQRSKEEQSFNSRQDDLDIFKDGIRSLYEQYDSDTVNTFLAQFIQEHKKENEEHKMNDDKHNASGCLDLTAYEAINNI